MNNLVPAENAEECSEAALFRRQRQLVVGVVLGVRLRNQRNLRETLGVLLCGLIEYSCVLFSR